MTDDTRMARGGNDGDEGVRDGHPVCVLPKGRPWAGSLRYLARHPSLAFLYLLAVACWWIPMGVVAGAGMEQPVLVPLPGSCSMLSLPTALVVAACSMWGALYVSRPAAPMRLLPVVLSIVLPSALSQASNELLLLGPDAFLEGLWPVVVATVGVVLWLYGDDRLGSGPREIAATVVLAALVCLCLTMASRAEDRAGFGFWAFPTTSDGEAPTASDVVADARALADGWEATPVDERGMLVAEYLRDGYRLFGVDAHPLLAVEPGAIGEVSYDPEEGWETVVSVPAMAAPGGEGMLRRLDALVADVSLAEHEGDIQALLWMFESDDPVVHDWARTVGTTYSDLENGIGEGEREEYEHMVMSVMSSMRAGSEEGNASDG